MPLELKYEESVYQRTKIFAVEGEAIIEHPDYHTIHPDSLKIELSRKAEDARWEIDFVTIVGRRILKAGTVGVAEASQLYTTTVGRFVDPHMPAWARRQAEETLRQSEEDRRAHGSA